MYQDTFITIEHGKEYQARKESIYDKNAFFFDCYRQAADCLREILAIGQAFISDHPELDQAEESYPSAASANVNKALLGYPNNIIAFCAERGQGKTSAMISFANALHEMPLSDRFSRFYSEKESFWNDPNVLDSQFVVVGRIDPTTMADRESILKTVLSRMFNLCQIEWEQRTKTAERSSYVSQANLQSMRLDILKQFQNCYRSLQVIENSSSSENTDSLEQMLERGDSSNLRGAMYILIQRFLAFMCPNNEKKSCLVIQIDDADFNIERAYNIIDDIRRYLVLPRVAVLLSANMTQLETTVEQHFIEQYSTSIQNSGMASVERCHDIAERYISKVVPGFHRIFLPDLQKYMASQYEHIQVKYLDADGKNLLDEVTDQGIIHYQDQLLRFLYQRTGLILLKPESFLHNLLPGNMRELTHFLVFFSQLDRLEPEINYFGLVDHFSGKCPLAEDKIELWRNNLLKAERYLMELWAPINLRTEGHTLLRSLQSDPDDNKNRNLLRLLPDYYGHERAQASRVSGNSHLNWTEYRNQFKEACRIHGLSIYDTTGPADGCAADYDHTSYADVCEALNVLSSLPDSSRHYKLIYAIHFFYTIRLNLLLLEQIELSMQPELPAENMLSQFLADVLFIREDMKKSPQGYALWQYDLCVDDLRKLLPLYQSNNQQSLSHLTTFCRSVQRVNHSYVTRQIENLDWLTRMYDPLHIQFNFFYSNLYDIDILTSHTSQTKNQLCNENDPSSRNKMAGSFALLLNWDVQYEFLRNLRFRSQNSIDILQNMRGVFEGQPTHRLLSRISQLTDLNDYLNVFQFYRNYYMSESEAFGAVIQCVAPDIKHNILLRMKTHLEALQQWPKLHISDDIIFKNIPDSLTPTAVLVLTALQHDITPLLYLREITSVEKEGLATEWNLEKVRNALNIYAAVLKDEMEREGIPPDAKLSGPTI